MLFTALAVLRISQSQRKLCARFHWQPSCKIASSVWMEEVSLQEATAEISLQSIRRSKRSGRGAQQRLFPYPVGGWQKHPSQREKTLSTASFSVCHTLAVYLQTKLKPETVVAYFHGPRLVSWVWLSRRWECVGNCYT